MFNGSTLPAMTAGCCLSGAAGKARKAEKAAQMQIPIDRVYAPGYAPLPAVPTPFQLPAKKLAKIEAKARAAALYPMPLGPPIILTAEPGVIQSAPGGLVAPAPGVADPAAAGDGGILSGVSDFFANIPTTYLYIGGAVLAYMMFKKGR